MNFIVDHPILVLVLSLIGLYLAECLGIFWHKGRGDLRPEEREDFSFVVSPALTLLGLIIGFTFSMSISRYDQRKNYEEAEANAIGTEYVRAELLPEADAPRVRELLAKYLDQRVLFYETRDDTQLRQIDAATSRLQSALWTSVRVPASALPTPVTSLAVAGMNDVLNSQGYTQAARWNRIPIAAWILMATIAVCCNLMIGYGVHHAQTTTKLLLVTPFLISISFFLISDIDSPVGGVIRVHPQNLITLAQALRTR